MATRHPRKKQHRTVQKTSARTAQGITGKTHGALPCRGATYRDLLRGPIPQTDKSLPHTCASCRTRCCVLCTARVRHSFRSMTLVCTLVLSIPFHFNTVMFHAIPFHSTPSHVFPFSCLVVSCPILPWPWPLPWLVFFLSSFLPYFLTFLLPSSPFHLPSFFLPSSFLPSSFFVLPLLVSHQRDLSGLAMAARYHQ